MLRAVLVFKDDTPQTPSVDDIKVFKRFYIDDTVINKFIAVHLADNVRPDNNVICNEKYNADTKRKTYYL